MHVGRVAQFGIVSLTGLLTKYFISGLFRALSTVSSRGEGRAETLAEPGILPVVRRPGLFALVHDLGR